ASGQGAGVRVLDLDAILKESPPDQNVVLQDQDIISVPELIQEVSVLGEVNRPGTYRIHKETRVLDVLALAGGIRPEGDATSAVLTSRSPSGEVRRTIDLESLQAAGGSGQNYPVRNGDVLYVPKATTVMVLGKVKAPGTYTLRASSRLMDAVSRAGGPAPDGDPTAVTLTRRGGAAPVEAVNVEAIMAGDSEHNVPLRDGDIVFVPELVREVSVLGEVARPGVYPIRKVTTLLEALALAGGITQMGDNSAIRLTRRTANGEPRTLEFDADRPSKAGDVSTWVLRDGDAIYVPRAIAVQVLGEVGKPGRYYLKAGSCVLDAIALAGGLTQDADGSSVTLTPRTRTVGADGVEGGVYLLDMRKVQAGADLAANRRLSDEDTIFVPRADREVLVVGEVQRPGIYKVREDARLMDAIALAGGPTKRAALEAVCVFRKGEIRAGEQVVLGRDNLFFSGKADVNPQVLGGDIVYVPATSKIEWESVFSFLSGLKLIKDLLGR
ncbi:MAG: SLBB domain-containing protein, partial [Bacillota bacterium]